MHVYVVHFISRLEASSSGHRHGRWQGVHGEEKEGVVEGLGTCRAVRWANLFLELVFFLDS